jgi:hypothetical protein
MSLRVSLAPRARPLPIAGGATPAALPLLDPRGARVILGAPSDFDQLATPIRPSAQSLFGPRGACLVAPSGPLAVCDTGHHRLLIWHRAPARDDTPADIVIGHADFTHEGRNGNGAVGAATLNVPTGVAFGGGVLAVADAWNHRVLLWHGVPRHSRQPADVVLGQADFVSGLANRGDRAARADTLNWCYGVAIDDAGRLLVADTGNRRVLIWHDLPERNGAPADQVLGQRDFAAHDDSGGAPVGARGMRWPHAIAAAGNKLFVADAGSSRVMVWMNPPHENGAPCDRVLGQGDFAGTDHNRGAYDPTAAVLNMPYGIALQEGRLIIADTANSRLLGFALDDLASGSSARFIAGQPGFGDKGDNRWQAARRDSLCWPYAVSTCANTAIIADSGNNRVLLWEAA